MALPKIVGYGVCGPSEPYLEATLNEFKRLCDETIICFNNANQREKALVQSYGFKTVEDNREWGKLQWKLKEDFVTNHVAKLNPDLCVCLDMDEVFDKNLTREGLYRLYQSEFKSFYFYIINLWDDGYNKARSFWNIRAWKWDKELGTKFPQKNLHCGLAPEWVWVHAFYSPYLLKHYGLQSKERRQKKSERYKKYDPTAKFIAKEYYDSLESYQQVEPFDEDKIHGEVVQYVQDIKQKYIKSTMEKEEVVYIQTLRGETAAVPKAKLQDYLRQGCKHLVEHETLNEYIDKILEEPTEVVATPDEIVATVEDSPTRSICGTCAKEFKSPRALRAHKMYGHRSI